MKLRQRVPIDPEVAYAHLKSKVNWAKCDRCGFNWPEDLIRVKDGAKTCPNHGAWKLGRSEKDFLIAREKRRIVNEEAQTREPKYPFKGEMSGVSGVSGITPTPPIPLLIGGSDVVVILDGVNLSAADAITFSHASITQSVPAIYSAVGADGASNTATLTLRLDIVSAVAGSYDLLYGADRFREILQVRS